jgi:hypothetical protein
MGVSRIHYLFPPETVHELPRWKFQLHLKKPDFLVYPRMWLAIRKLRRTHFSVLNAQLERLTFPESDEFFGYVAVSFEVPEAQRNTDSALERYESDFWKLLAILVGYGFGLGDFFYEAVDFKESPPA